jgi:outer membrane protein assembly factor BamB
VFDLSDPREWSKVASLSKLPMWTFQADGPLDATPCLRNGTLFFGSRDTHVYAISAQSGRLLWKEKAGRLSEVTSTPAVTATVIIVGTVDGAVIAFDPSSGQVRWKFSTRGFIRSAPEINEAAERGCVASADGLIYGFSTSSGNVTWKTDAGAPISANAARQADLVIYVTEKGTVLALDIVTGNVLWSEETGVNAVGIALADSTAVVASSNGEVIGLNIESGKIISRKVARGKLDSPPVASRGQVLVATHLGEVAFFQAGTGTETRRIELPQEAPAHLTSDGNLLVAVTPTGAIFAVDVSTGELIWPAATSGAVDSVPLITDQGIFVVSRDHNIYAYPRNE